MAVKVKENFDKTRHVEINKKSKKYILPGQRNVRYHERILSNKKKSSIYLRKTKYVFVNSCRKRPDQLVRCFYHKISFDGNNSLFLSI